MPTSDFSASIARRRFTELWREALGTDWRVSRERALFKPTLQAVGITWERDPLLELTGLGFQLGIEIFENPKAKYHDLGLDLRVVLTDEELNEILAYNNVVRRRLRPIPDADPIWLDPMAARWLRTRRSPVDSILQYEPLEFLQIAIDDTEQWARWTSSKLASWISRIPQDLSPYRY